MNAETILDLSLTKEVTSPQVMGLPSSHQDEAGLRATFALTQGSERDIYVRRQMVGIVARGKPEIVRRANPRRFFEKFGTAYTVGVSTLVMSGAIAFGGFNISVVCGVLVFVIGGMFEAMKMDGHFHRPPNFYRMAVLKERYQYCSWHEFLVMAWSNWKKDKIEVPPMLFKITSEIQSLDWIERDNLSRRMMEEMGSEEFARLVRLSLCLRDMTNKITCARGKKEIRLDGETEEFISRVAEAMGLDPKTGERTVASSVRTLSWKDVA